MTFMKKGPMLASSEILPMPEVTWPKLGSFKFDGLRQSIGDEHKPYTRSLLQLPNNYAREVITEAKLPVGLDGELGCLDCNGVMQFKKSMSALTSEDGEPEFRFYIFDNYNYDGAFLSRLESIQAMKLPEWCVIADQRDLNSTEEAMAMYRESLDLGHEGLILRDPLGPYKFGRATSKSQWALKMKPKRTAEAEIVAVEQKMKNTNARERDARGHAKRSGALIGKVPVEAVGMLVCRWVPGQAGLEYTGTFGVGGGWDADEAKAWWLHSPVGQIATLEFAETGGYEKPRHAQFKGFRHMADL